MNKFRQKIQNKLLSLSEKGKEAFIFTYAFFESFFLVLPPPDPFLIYIIFTNTKKWIRYTTILVVSSVIGGLFSYLVSYFFFGFFENWLLGFEYVAREYEKAKILFNKNSFIAVFLAGLTPIPYTVFTIAAGVFKTNLISFLIASILGRGLRFFIVGLISYLLGKKFANLFVKYFDIVAFVTIILIVLYLFF